MHERDSAPTRLGFWTQGSAPSTAEAGCRVHALNLPVAESSSPSLPLETVLPPLRGRLLAGSYAEVAARLPESVKHRPAAALCLFARGTGMEAFLQQVTPALQDLPVTGGAAARPGGAIRGDMIPGAEGVLVVLIDEGRWEAKALNIHEPSGRLFELETEEPRVLRRLRPAGGHWETAAAVYRRIQQEFGLPESDCETVTFSDLAGRNVHCSIAGDDLLCGSDLPPSGSRLELRWTTPHHVTERLAIFAHPPRSLVFACAGLHRLIGQPPHPGTGSCVSYLYGELVPLEDGPRFANLMVSRLTRVG